MSEDQVLDRKAKKAQRDAERKKSGKKRKHEEVEEEAKDELKQDFIPLATAAEESTSKSKKRKAEAVEEPATTTASKDTTATKKKRRKSSKATTNGDTTAKTSAEGESEEATKPTKSRFILFIGNLPYTATDETINAHFRKITPFTLRHRTDPKTRKSKGFAFLEFENYDRMKTCLKLYHHSTFDPEATEAGAAAAETAASNAGAKGRKKKDHSRKINVELTAGGGGKGTERKEKIKVKNVRLEEQRQRRRELEAKEALKAEKKKGKKVTGANDGALGEKAVEAPGDAGDAMGDVHPSRLAMMK